MIKIKYFFTRHAFLVSQYFSLFVKNKQETLSKIDEITTKFLHERALAIIISYPTSASGITVSLEASPKM